MHACCWRSPKRIDLDTGHQHGAASSRNTSFLSGTTLVLRLLHFAASSVLHMVLLLRFFAAVCVTHITVAAVQALQGLLCLSYVGMH